ncbi:hypothetical protein HYW20_00130 [Candidatus Woesearchaeota archaeon]|nr:hypothetical protein [Candidatus Woesearchaeota archaeon]
MEIGVPDYEKERIETQSATAKPSSLSAQVLPFISSENFSRNCKTNGSSLYHTGGCTRRTRIAGNLEGGNNEVFKKSLSRVNIALDSLHASEYSLEFLTPFTAYLMSTPLFDKDLTNLASTSSSARNLSFNMDKSFTSQSLSCIVQGCFDVLLSQRRISLENVLETFSSFEHFQDRMNHNSGAFESGLSVADFAVRDNKFIDFGSHEADSGNLVFKDIGIKFERIESIKALDEQQVYDLNIEGTHNFIANDIIAHNTGSDSNNPPVSNGIFPNVSINTSGLVGLWYFNNESGYGENNSLVRDFSPDVNAQRAGSVRNNGTCVINATPTCPVYNFSDKRLGRGAMRFDGVNDYVQVTGLLGSAATVTLAGWANLNAPDSEGGDLISLGSAVALRLRDPTSGNKTYGVYRYATNWRSVTTPANFDVTGWHHFVYVVNPGASSQILYIDGVQIASTSFSDAISYSLGVNTFIGKDGNGGTVSDFNGLIDEVSIWNRTLSSAEISQLYKRGAFRLNLSVRSCDDAVCAGEDYSVNATNSTSSSISALSNNRYVQYKAFFTSLKGSSENSTAPELYNVTVHYSTPVDTTPPKFTGNSTNLTTPVLNNTAAFSINVSDGVGLQNVIFAWNGTSGAEIGNISADSSNGILPGINTSGLVGLWHFNNQSNYGENDTNVTDFSVYVNAERFGSRQNNGSVYNGAHYNFTNKTLGKGAMDFDGSDDYVDAGSDTSLDGTGSGPMTYSAWIYPKGVGEGADGGIINRDDDTNVGWTNFALQNTASIYFSRDYLTTNLVRGAVNNVITYGAWQHVAVTWDGSATASNVHIYVNGQEVSYESTTNGVDALQVSEAHPIIIGNKLTAERTFNGTIDEVAIWNRSLSSAEIKELYARGNKFTNVSASGTLPASTTSLNWTYNITLPQTGVVAWQFTANDTSGNMMQSDIFNFTVNYPTAANAAPVIKINNATFSADPVAGTSVPILLSFNITDPQGVSDINASKFIINLTLGGLDGQFRFNISGPDANSEFGTCYNHTEPGPGSEAARMIINCTLLLMYYDNASALWTINASIKDISSSAGINDTLRFTYNSLSSISLTYAAVNFSNVFLGQQDVPSSPLTLNNTGNDDFDMINITASALVGTSITTESIAPTNFYVNITNQTAGAGLQLGAAAVSLIEFDGANFGKNASLVHGHTGAFAPNADKGNRTIFFWVDVPSGGLSSQLFNATWNVTVSG